MKPSELRTTFLNRLERFKTIESLNQHLPAASAPTEPSKPRPLPLHFDPYKSKNPGKSNCRYIYEKLSDRSDVLDRLLEEAAMILAEWYEIKEWADPSVVSQEDTVEYAPRLKTRKYLTRPVGSKLVA